MFGLPSTQGAGLEYEYALVYQGGAGAKPHVEIPEEWAFDVTTALTVEAWVRFDAVASGKFAPKWQAIVTKGEAWGLTRYSNLNRVAFRTSNGTSVHSLSTKEDFEPETWYHVAGVFDGSRKSLYVDGILVNSAEWSGPLATNDFKVLVGCNEEFSTRVFVGRIDTVRVWSAARTEAQVNAVKQHHVLGTETGLLGAWRFDEEPGGANDGKAIDASEQRRDGTLQSMNYTPKRTVGVTFGAPPVGDHAVQFSGTNEYIELAKEEPFDFTTEMTAEAWVYLDPPAAAAVLSEDNSKSAWTDRTEEAASADTADVQPFGAFAADQNDACYIGCAATFDRARIAYTTAGQGTNVTAKTAWEYWDGTTWQALTVTDSSNAFTEDAGTYTLTWSVPGDWATTTLSAPDPHASQTDLQHGPHYYIRLRCTADSVYDVGMPVLDDVLLVQNSVLISKGSSAWEVGLDADGKVTFTTSGVGSTLTGTTALSLRTWTHVAAMFDGSTKWIFVNGSLDAAESGLSGSIDTNATKVRFGVSASDPTESFSGGLDEVRLWSGARTQELIAASYQLSLTGHEPELAGWWPFDGDNGGVVADRKETVNANAAVTVAFEHADLQHADNRNTPLPDAYNQGKRYEESGFRFDNLSATSKFYTVGTLNHDYAGSTMLYNNDRNGLTKLTAVNGSLFQFESITLNDFDNRPTGAVIPFTVTLEDDKVTQRTLSYTAGDGLKTFTFPDLLRVKAVEWKQAGGYYQFDDVVVRPSVAVADSVLATGYLVNMSDRNFTAGVSLGSAITAEYALAFNGTDHRVSVPHNDVLNLDSFTIEAWVKAEPNTGPLRNILMKGDNGYGLALDEYGRVRYWVSGNAADALACDTWTTTTTQAETAGTDVVVEVEDVSELGIGQTVSIATETGLRINAVDPVNNTITVDLATPKAAGSTVMLTPVTNGRWHHVGVSVDRTTNTTKFYVDGAPAGEQEGALDTGPTVNNNTGALIIGRQGLNTSAGYFKGALNEIRIWDHVRSDGEIELLANRQLVPGMTGLIAYWSLNDGVGTTTADGSGNGLDGSLQGTLTGANAWEWIYGPQAPFRTGMYALMFDGEDDYVNVTHNAALDATDVTIEAWVYPLENSTEDGLRTVVFKGETGYNLSIDELGHVVYSVVTTTEAAVTQGSDVTVEVADAAGFAVNDVVSITDGTNDETAVTVEQVHSSSRPHFIVLDLSTDKLAGAVVAGRGRVRSTRAVSNGRWHHVAVVVDVSVPSTTFYVDGAMAGVFPTAVAATNSDALIIGREGLTSADARNHFHGLIDELRVWGVARSATQIAAHAARQLPTDVTGLIGYWPFNEGEELSPASTVNGLVGTLVNADVSAWSAGQSRIDTDGDLWDADALGSGADFSRQPGAKGLWIGRVVLSAVNEVHKATSGDPGAPAETDDTASFRAIVHVDEDGIVRLLKHVTLMQKAEGETDSTVDEEDITDSVARQIVLVSDDTKLPEFQGLIKRRGKLIGKRISSVAYDFEGNEVELVGGVGGGLSLTGTVTLPRLHPTNPFRHKYHPDHRNVNPDNADYGFEIVRNITFTFARPDEGLFLSGGYGVDRLIGAYYEEVTGLHKVPIRVAGSVVLDRISTVAVLNE